MIGNSGTDAPAESLNLRQRLPHCGRRSLADRTVRPAIIDLVGPPSAKPLIVDEAEVTLPRVRARPGGTASDTAPTFA